jgi:hypothetical protein
MNIFVLDENPVYSSRMMCDKHIPKMVIESAQMMGSALRRHGAVDDEMPLTNPKWVKAMDGSDTMWFIRTPYKGGYHNHPCSVWTQQTRSNFQWLYHHAMGLCYEFTKRYGSVHSSLPKIQQMWGLRHLIPEGELTPFARAFNGNDHLKNENEYSAVEAYRAYYFTKRFKRGDSLVPPWWEKGTPAPYWWVIIQEENV